MKIKQIDFINSLGIGVFLFLSVEELSYLLERILRDIHSLLISGSESFLWLPELIGLIFFTLIFLWAFKTGPNLVRKNANKTFIYLMVIFFVILFLEFLYPIFGTKFMIEKYSEEYETYFDLRKNYMTQGIISVIQALKIVVFTILIIIKRKTVANNG